MIRNMRRRINGALEKRNTNAWKKERKKERKKITEGKEKGEKDE